MLIFGHFVYVLQDNGADKKGRLSPRSSHKGNGDFNSARESVEDVGSESVNRISSESRASSSGLAKSNQLLLDKRLAPTVCDASVNLDKNIDKIVQKVLQLDPK